MKSRLLALLLGISSASSQFAWINSGSSAGAADDNQNGNSLDWARFFFSFLKKCDEKQLDSKVWDVGPLNNTMSILSGAMPQKMIQQITEYLFALLTGRIKLSDKPDTAIHSRYFGSSEEDEDDEKRSVHKNAEVLDYETQVMINDAIDTAKQKAGSNKITKADLESAFAKQRDEPTKFANRLKAIGHEFSELSSPPVRSSVSAFKKPVKVYDEREFRRKPVIHLSNTVIRKRISTFQGISRKKTPTSPNFARSSRITNSVPHLSYDPKFAAFKYAFVKSYRPKTSFSPYNTSFNSLSASLNTSALNKRRGFSFNKKHYERPALRRGRVSAQVNRRNLIRLTKFGRNRRH
ncbi:hypothetical protein WR25_20655 [Diploscapter pachys]|uniref:Uncharacterized protein n=1 Tax=Diploscapter pachys TaxID=2018661 RepID=A0A2A2L2J8_9BILA|nr:hypothetical protein WR25_20655 [Diploscapter pachys]